MTMMKQMLKSRALFTLENGSVRVKGTYHKPADQIDEFDIVASARGRVGVVFLNTLSTPRAGFADSAVYWADAFAGSGYPSFRFDLPGLGDTCGEIPMELLTFITKGAHASIVVEKVKELVETFN